MCDELLTVSWSGGRQTRFDEEVFRKKRCNVFGSPCTLTCAKITENRWKNENVKSAGSFQAVHVFISPYCLDDCYASQCAATANFCHDAKHTGVSMALHLQSIPQLPSHFTKSD